MFPSMIHYTSYLWIMSSIITLGTGLTVLNLNILQSLKIASLRIPLKYISGVIGTLSLISFIMIKQHGIVMMFPGNTKLAPFIWIITALVSLSLGLSAMKINVLKSTGLLSWKKELLYIAIIVGIYGIISYIGMS